MHLSMDCVSFLNRFWIYGSASNSLWFHLVVFLLQLFSRTVIERVVCTVEIKKQDVDDSFSSFLFIYFCSWLNILILFFNSHFYHQPNLTYSPKKKTMTLWTLWLKIPNYWYLFSSEPIWNRNVKWVLYLVLPTQVEVFKMQNKFHWNFLLFNVFFGCKNHFFMFSKKTKSCITAAEDDLLLFAIILYYHCYDYIVVIWVKHPLNSKFVFF
jgi:hypothetical protein